MSLWSKLFGKKKKVEPVKEEVKPVVEEVEEPLKAEPVKEDAPVVEEKVEEPVVEDEVYQVKVHPEKGWQVLKKDAKRALRRFNTQSECIAYCKENDFKYVVFKKDGTLR